MEKKETARQLTHLTGLALVYFVIALGKTLTTIIAGIAATFLFFIAMYKGVRMELRKKMPLRIAILEQLEDAFFDIVNAIDRKSYFPYFGAFTFYLASFFVLLFFPETIAIVSIATLAVFDSVATLVGVHLGRHKIFYNKQKSWEGSFSGFVATLGVALFFTNPLNAFIASLVAFAVESLPVRIDDNLTIPMAVAVVLSVMKSI